MKMRLYGYPAPLMALAHIIEDVSSDRGMPIYRPIGVLPDQDKLPIGEWSVIITVGVIDPLKIVAGHDKPCHNRLEDLLPEGLHHQPPQAAHHSELIPRRMPKRSTDCVGMKRDVRIDKEQPLGAESRSSKAFAPRWQAHAFPSQPSGSGACPPSMTVSLGSRIPSRISPVRSVEPSFNTTTCCHRDPEQGLTPPARRRDALRFVQERRRPHGPFEPVLQFSSAR